MGRGVYSTFRLDERDKQTIYTFNLLSHYIATGVIDGIPLAYVQTEFENGPSAFGKEITEAIGVLKSYCPDSYTSIPGKKRADLVMRYLSALHNVHDYLNYTTKE